MDNNLLLTPTPKKRYREFKERKHPFPIFSNKSQQQQCGSWDSNGKWKCYIGHLKESCVVVNENETIKSLYTMGFFGKGTMSRSAPQICFKSKSSKENAGIEGANESDFGDSDSSDEESNTKKQNLDKGADDETEDNTLGETEDSTRGETEDSTRGETEDNTCDDTTGDQNPPVASDPEQLQLTFEEAFFLSYGLGCLVVMDKNQPLDLQTLWQKFCELAPDKRFPVMYTAYHHFRSKGWVVRSGLKYGTDFVLYKDGPPYYHSTYAVVVKPVKEKNLKETFNNNRLQPTWTSLAALNRVVSQVSKGLMFLYVIRPEFMSENKVSTPYCISQFKLQEQLIKRWVPASGREDED